MSDDGSWRYGENRHILKLSHRKADTCLDGKQLEGASHCATGIRL
jgi:hypothetical protein